MCLEEFDKVRRSALEIASPFGPIREKSYQTAPQRSPESPTHSPTQERRPGKTRDGVDTDNPTKKKAPFLWVCRPPCHPRHCRIEFTSVLLPIRKSFPFLAFARRPFARSASCSRGFSLNSGFPGVPPRCFLIVQSWWELFTLLDDGSNQYFTFNESKGSESNLSLKKANKHTIILMQSSPNRATRTFMDYDSIGQAMDGICGLYERKLNDLNPTMRNIQYDIADLYNFIDGLADMSALVFEHSIQAYLPYDRQWIKQRIFNHLKRLANN